MITHKIVSILLHDIMHAKRIINKLNVFTLLCMCVCVLHIYSIVIKILYWKWHLHLDSTHWSHNSHSEEKGKQRQKLLMRSLSLFLGISIIEQNTNDLVYKKHWPIGSRHFSTETDCVRWREKEIKTKIKWKQETATTKIAYYYING